MQGATPIGSPLLSQEPFFRTLLVALRRMKSQNAAFVTVG